MNAHSPILGDLTEKQRIARVDRALVHNAKLDRVKNLITRLQCRNIEGAQRNDWFEYHKIEWELAGALMEALSADDLSQVREDARSTLSNEYSFDIVEGCNLTDEGDQIWGDAA